MVFVFFVYGLAFFVLGLAIFIYSKKDSIFKLAKDLCLIGAFGMLHGINEWIDMFILIQKPEELLFLKAVRAFIMPLSFVFLVQFGVKVIAEAKKEFGWIKSLAFILPVAWACIFALTKERFLYGDIFGRYLLGFPGAILTAWGLILQVPNFKDIKLTSIKRNLKIGASFFAFYAVLAGIIVPKAGFLPAAVLNYSLFLQTFGFPIQILRTLSAVAIAIFIGKTLVVFDWESKEKLKDLVCSLKKANEELGASQKELQVKNEELSLANEELRTTTEELQSTNEELKQTNEELESMTEELRAANEEAQRAKEVAEKKAADLERFNKVAVGRELKMRELKERVEELEKSLGKKPESEA